MFTYNIIFYLFNSNMARPSYFSVYSFPFHFFVTFPPVCFSMPFVLCHFSTLVMLLQLFLQLACFCLYAFIHAIVNSIQRTVVQCRLSYICITTFTDFLLGNSKCFSFLMCGFSFFFSSSYYYLFKFIHK